MKIFLLVVLFIMLISRIKNTPSMLNKTLYMKKMQKAIDKAESLGVTELLDEVGFLCDAVAFLCDYRKTLERAIEKAELNI